MKGAIPTLKAKRGIIVETNGKNSYILDEAGVLHERLFSDEHMLGDIVPLDHTKRNYRQNMRLLYVAAAILVLIIVPLFVFAPFGSGEPVSYASIDINPSIVLNMDNRDTVLSYKCFNDEAIQLVEGLDLQKASLQQALTSILTNAKKQGYLDSTGSANVYIAIASSKAEKLSGLNSLVKASFKDCSIPDSRFTVESISVDQCKRASKIGVSPGKLALAEKISKTDKDSSINDLLKQNVNEFGKDTNIQKQTESATAPADKITTQPTVKTSIPSDLARPKATPPVRSSKTESIATAKPEATRKPKKTSEPDKNVFEDGIGELSNDVVIEETIEPTQTQPVQTAGNPTPQPTESGSPIPTPTITSIPTTIPSIISTPEPTNGPKKTPRPWWIIWQEWLN